MTVRRYRWRGPQPRCNEEQIANAPDDFTDLTPVSGAAAAQTTANWAAALPNNVPFVWDPGAPRVRHYPDDRPVNEEP